MTDFAVATLILRGCDITDTETSLGVTNATRSILSFRNINLRSLLGDLYDQYDTFNLSLTSISSARTPAALGASFGDNNVDNLNLTLYIEGLPFINNSYDPTRGGQTGRAVLGGFSYPTGNHQIFYRVYNQSGTVTFGKSQDMCNITLIFKRVVDNADPVTVDAFPNTNFTFLINGISPKSKTNGTRI